MRIRGYNTKKKQWIYLSISAERTLYVGLWQNIDPLSIGISTEQTDISGTEVFSGDLIESYLIQNLDMQVKYGTYQAYCPVDQCYMDSIGFYVSTDGLPDMPVGPLREYAKNIGNVYEKSEAYRNSVRKENDDESIRLVREHITADLAANREELKAMTEGYNEHFLDEIMRDD